MLVDGSVMITRIK